MRGLGESAETPAAPKRSPGSAPRPVARSLRVAAIIVLFSTIPRFGHAAFSTTLHGSPTETIEPGTPGKLPCALLYTKMHQHRA